MTLEQIVSAEISLEKMSFLTKEELIILLKGEQDFRKKLQSRLATAEALNELLKQRSMCLQEQYCTIKSKLYGKSSEKSPKSSDQNGQEEKKEKKKRVLLPSERYPDAPLIEQHITLDVMPPCPCCSSQMQDSGLTEDSEFLTVVPEQYIVVRQMRHKYRCSHCQGSLKTAPLPPRIQEGSSLSDEMMIDVALSKYCDLIPIERYSKIAERGGLKDLPPQTLIESTHYLAHYVEGVYLKLKAELTAAPVLHADETPHRMLEGDAKSSWYLWGFSTDKTSYYECHGTRSGDVASRFLTDAQCTHLASDVYSGYGKAIREANEQRKLQNRPPIEHVYCNAHSRRYFKQASPWFPQETQFYIDQYREIYKLHDRAKDKPPDEVLGIRRQMRSYFEAIRQRCVQELSAHSNKSKLAKAMKYFLKNYDGLTRFLNRADLPIDNNSQERLLRNPVIGRKTWYGTHSKQGAKTAAILFSLVESCKLNGVNPRRYFKQLVQDLHAGKPSFTPAEFATITRQDG